MKKHAFIYAVGALCIIGCNTTEIQEVNGVLSATATIEVKTKVDYTDNGAKKGVTAVWSADETFKAYYEGASEPLVFDKSGAGNSFVANGVPGGVSSETQFRGLYGKNATLDSNGKIAIDFTGQDGTLDGLSAFDVMTADSKLSEGVLNFAFKHNCAILRLECVNHTTKKVSKVKLRFHNVKISEDFSETGITQAGVFLALKFELKSPVAEGSSEYGKGHTETRYAIVPAMSYQEAKVGLPTSSTTDAFEKTIELSDSTKSIEAGKVYDVKCEAGLEEAEGGGYWSD